MSVATIEMKGLGYGSSRSFIFLQVVQSRVWVPLSACYPYRFFILLIGTVVAPEVRATAVASPAEVLELNTHSSSKADPSKSSPPPVFVAPMVSPFLCSDDSESDTEIPERHVSSTTFILEIPTALILPTPSVVVAPSSVVLIALALIAREVGLTTLPSHRLALRYTSHHLDHFTSRSSSSHSSSDHSSLGHSILGHSLSGHTPPDITNADSSTS
ncbi:hypothetical protein Tco_0210570 [Tanacetum coccineum]